MSGKCLSLVELCSDPQKTNQRKAQQLRLSRRSIRDCGMVCLVNRQRILLASNLQQLKRPDNHQCNRKSECDEHDDVGNAKFAISEKMERPASRNEQPNLPAFSSSKRLPGFSAAYLCKVFGKRDRSAKGPRSDRVSTVPAWQASGRKAS